MNCRQGLAFCWLGLMALTPILSAQFLDADGRLTGYTIELVQEIQKRVGNTDAIQMVPWARGYEQIQRESNVVLFMMSRTAERNDLFKWVGPVLETVFGFYAKADSKISLATLEDAKKIGSIGVYLNDVRAQYLTKAGFTNLDQVADNSLNVKKLMAGRIDLLASSSTAYGGDATMAGFKPADLKLVLPFQKIQVYIAMSKNMPPQVVDSWNAALNAVRQDGIMEKLLKKYYPQSTMPGPAITKF